VDDFDFDCLPQSVLDIRIGFNYFTNHGDLFDKRYDDKSIRTFCRWFRSHLDVRKAIRSFSPL
jgi:hypothetical protein